MANRLILALLLLWLPLSTWALGLSGIEVSSALNQPLDARIEITTGRQVDIEDFSVSLAGLKEFQTAGIERPYFLSKLRFTVKREPAGQAYVHVTTRESVREPFLIFLIRVEQRGMGGVMHKEYTLLLDPPIYKPEAVSAPKSTVQTSTPGMAGDERRYGPVKQGDTLWVIARNSRPDNRVSIEQMMMALQRRNPDAFNRGNVNLLRRGAELVIPGIDAVREMSHQQARQVFLDQTNAWRNARSGRGTAVKTVRPQPVLEAAPVATAEPTVDQEAAETAATGEEQVAPDEVREGYLRVVETGEERQLSEALPVDPADEPEVLHGLIEEKGRELEQTREINQDLKALRVALEGEIAMLQKSMEEKDRAIEQLRLRLDGAQMRVVDETPQQPLPSTEQPAPAALSPPPETGTDQVITQWIKNRDDSELLAVAAAVLLLLVVMAVLLFRQKRAVAVPAVIPIVDETWQEVGGAAPDRAGLKKADTEVAPSLMMTDVYLGYHQYAQAESMILKMIDAHPDRLSLKVKLLEIYSAKKDRDMFAQYLEEVHERLAAEAPGLWEKVAGMGRELIPKHPLFASEESDSLIDTPGYLMEQAVDFNDIVIDPEFDIELSADDLPVESEEPQSDEDLDSDSILEGLDLSSLEVVENIDQESLLLSGLELPDTGELEVSDLTLDEDDWEIPVKPGNR
ncbi:MAG: FimV/HubP family polar landmark protein [Sedimenticola sp.]